MNFSILQNARAEDVRMEPFPHIVIDNALNGELYRQLESQYPFESKIEGYSGYANNTRYQISAVDGLRENRLSPLWQEFVSYHVSKEFLAEVAHIFAPAIAKYYPQLSLDGNVGVRFRDRAADVWMDCQPGMNSPVAEITSVKGPHLDNPHELYAALLYFRHHEDTSSGGDLELYKYGRNDYRLYGQRFVDSKYLEKVGESVSYAPNRLVLFLNSIDSVHAVTPRQVTNYTRRLVNFIGEVDTNPLFNIPWENALSAKARQIFKLILPQ